MKTATVTSSATSFDGLISELRKLGYDISSLDELRRSKRQYRTAIPVILAHLSTAPLKDKEAVVRALSVPWAGTETSRALLSEFMKTQDEGLRWAIGNALEVLATPSMLKDLIDLSTNKQYGRSRQMVVLALGKINDRTVIATLRNLLRDDDVIAHAVAALRKLGALEALPDLKALERSSNALVRAEAKKAVNAILKSSKKAPIQ